MQSQTSRAAGAPFFRAQHSGVRPGAQQTGAQQTGAQQTGAQQTGAQFYFRVLTLLALGAVVVLNSGCSSLSGGAQTQDDRLSARVAKLQGVQHWQATGRIGLTTENQAVTGSVRWRQIPGRSELLLHSALGQGSTQIVSTPEQAVATTGTGETFSAATPEQLIKGQLGYDVPVTGLQDWLVGRPAPRPVVNVEFDDQGRLATLVQDGWEIQYLDYMQAGGVDLPRRLVLKRDDLLTKLVVRDWAKLSVSAPVDTASQPLPEQAAPGATAARG